MLLIVIQQEIAISSHPQFLLSNNNKNTGNLLCVGHYFKHLQVLIHLTCTKLYEIDTVIIPILQKRE